MPFLENKVFLEFGRQLCGKKLYLDASEMEDFFYKKITFPIKSHFFINKVFLEFGGQSCGKKITWMPQRWRTFSIKK